MPDSSCFIDASTSHHALCKYSVMFCIMDENFMLIHICYLICQLLIGLDCLSIVENLSSTEILCKLLNNLTMITQWSYGHSWFYSSKISIFHFSVSWIPVIPCNILNYFSLVHGQKICLFGLQKTVFVHSQAQ